jgi:hypothetical protein
MNFEVNVTTVQDPENGYRNEVNQSSSRQYMFPGFIMLTTT